MTKILEQIPLKPEYKQKLSNEKARSYAQLLDLERQLRQVKNQLENELSKEEVNMVEDIVNEENFDDVPKYLSVAEVAMITGLSPQMIRRNCANGKYDAYQPSGTNGVWLINSNTFRRDPKTWKEFVETRNELFKKTIEVAKNAIKLQDENLD